MSISDSTHCTARSRGYGGPLDQPGVYEPPAGRDDGEFLLFVLFAHKFLVDDARAVLE